MFGLLALLFIIVPIVELAVIVQVAHVLGVLPTIALVLLVSAAGAWLCKREGLGLYRRITAEVQAGQVPGASLVDGFLVLFAGALLLTPGFVSDVVGLALLLPPVRFAVRTVLLRRFARKARRAVAEGVVGGFGTGRSRGGFFIFDGRMGAAQGDAPQHRGGPHDRVIDVEEASYRRDGPEADRGRLEP